MNLVLLSALVLTAYASTQYQVQIRNRGLNIMDYESYYTDGRWESSPAKRLFPLTFTNAITSGIRNRVYYINKNTRKTANIGWGELGCTCSGTCDCTVHKVSNNSWKVDVKC
ncbi:hypothetical protein P9112_004855 [Eukaryota sp. TZLM1-RC]